MVVATHGQCQARGCKQITHPDDPICPSCLRRVDLDQKLLYWQDWRQRKESPAAAQQFRDRVQNILALISQESRPPAVVSPLDSSLVILAPLPAAEADRLFELAKDLDWQQNTMRMYGRSLTLPRRECIYSRHEGIAYNYGSVSLQAQPMPRWLDEIASALESETGYKFPTVIGNYYESGAHHIGWHADDDRSLGPDPAIASISLGGVRRFQIRRVDSEGRWSEKAITYDLLPGHRLLMPAGFQRAWKHRIMKESRECKPRINLTFRPYSPG